MMVLRQVLHEIESSPGAVELGALSRKLGVDQSALEGMVEYWVRKGRLRKNPTFCAGGGCGALCLGARRCPLEKGGARVDQARASF